MSDWDFLSSFVETMNQMTDSVEKFKLSCGLFLLSIFTGPKWYFINKSPEEIQKYYQELKHRDLLNLGVCLIGKSGSSHKSATIYKTANHFIYPILKPIDLPSDPDNPEADETIPQYIPLKVTESSFMQEANLRKDVKTGYNTFLQINPEFSVTVETSDLKYNIGLFQAFSMALSGERLSSSVRGRWETVEQPYFNMLLAAQENLPLILEDKVWTQGFPNRIMFAVDTYGIIFPPKDERAFKSKVDLTYPWRCVIELQEWLVELQKTKGERMLYMDTESRTLIREIHQQSVKQIGIKQDHPYYSGYLGRIETFAITLACLHRISRLAKHELEDGNNFEAHLVEQDQPLSFIVHVVEVEDTQWGIDQAMHYYEEFKILVQLRWRVTPVSKVWTDEAKVRLVYDGMVSWMKRHDKKEMPHQEVGKCVHMTKKPLAPLLEFLIDTERIEVCDNKKLGERGIRYEVISDWDTEKAPTVDEDDL